MSAPLVLDASVLIKLFIREEGTARAIARVRRAKALLAPDLLWAEAGNILWKYVRRRELEAEDASALLADMMAMPIEVTPCSVLTPPALRIAAALDRTVYDALYLALALREDAVMLTADQRLVNALRDTALARHVRGL